MTTGTMQVGNSALWRAVRWLVWGGAALLLLLPLVAMQFTREVNWTPLDFVFAAVMLGAVGVAYEVTVRVARSNAYVVAAGVAAGTAFLTTWINMAVGIVGEPQQPINLGFFAVVALALLGTALARLQPGGMARAMQATAIAQALVGVAAWVVAPAYPEGYIASGVFAALWLASAGLFRVAARADAGVAA